MKTDKKKIIIGATDHLALPDFGIDEIACKIDTGAYTSTLHCSRVRLIEKDDQSILCFKLYDPKFGISTKKEFRYTEFKERKVRSSNGEIDYRYSIYTTVVIFGKKIKTEFTLSFREKMKFPILLGRRFLKNRFIVDVTQKELSQAQLNQKTSR
ncbi:ATP-dependent zinc protease [Owenweeksia hongkongensis]|uniref:ATP-dependent zinc protease family protein n=1 Tax=Owenweeksia hongkongensis TaxID=253245 RepID=UPI003A91D578